MDKDSESVKKTLKSLFEKFEITKSNEDLGEIRFQINDYLDEGYDVWDEFARYRELVQRINKDE